MRVLLVETSDPHSTGSMSAYAALVSSLSNERFRIERLSLAHGEKELMQWPRALRNRLRLMTITREGSRRLPAVTADLVHVVDGSQAHIAHWLRPSVPFVVTVHDLIPLLQMKDRFPVARPGVAARWVIRRSVEQLLRAHCIVSDSESTRNDLVREVQVDQSSVRVIPLGLSPSFAGALLQIPPTPGEVSGTPLILHVGNNGFYKNRAGVVRIFARVRQETEVRLVIAGAPPDLHLFQLVRETGFGDDVTFVENPTPERIVEHYRSASLLLFPSLYEGFGWPPLEAMACGCPVVCSNGASLPEVVGDAALTAPPDDEEGLARLCLGVLREPALAQELSQLGLARAATFTTERMGRQLTAVYEEVLESCGR